MREGNIEVSTLLTSVGPANAARAVGCALEQAEFDLVISSGLAGGLRPEFRPGDVLVGRSVRRPDDGREFVAPAEWLDRAKKLGAREAVFVTAPRVAGTMEEKRELGMHGDAVEMESFAVIEQANGRGVPAMAIRAVSDPLEAALPIDFNRVFDVGGRLRPERLAREVFRRPAAGPGLIRLARDSRRASAALAQFLVRYVDAAAQSRVGAGTEK